MRPYSVSIEGFAKMIQSSPRLLARLLIGAGMANSQELRSGVNQFFRRLTPVDWDHVSDSGDLPLDREQQLARESMLPSDLSTLPISLYRSYCNSIIEQYAMAGTYQFSDEEVRYYLSLDGTLRPEYWFVIAEKGEVSIGFWDARSGGWGWPTMEVASLYEACIAYLRATGAVYSSLQEVIEKATCERWPYFEAFLRQ